MALTSEEKIEQLRAMIRSLMNRLNRVEHILKIPITGQIDPPKGEK